MMGTLANIFIYMPKSAPAGKIFLHLSGHAAYISCRRAQTIYRTSPQKIVLTGDHFTIESYNGIQVKQPDGFSISVIFPSFAVTLLMPFSFSSVDHPFFPIFVRHSNLLIDTKNAIFFYFSQKYFIIALHYIMEGN